jgi:ribosomal protein S27E
MPGLLKIGYTERAVEDRAAEVSSGTGIPQRFIVEAYFASPNPSLDEHTVHQSLKQYRLVNREFFEIDLDQSLQLLYQVVGRKPHFFRAGVTFETPEERQQRIAEEKMAGKIRIVCNACHKNYIVPSRAAKLTACPSCQSFEIEKFRGR